MRFPNHSLPTSSLTALAAALVVSALAPAAQSAQDSVADDATAEEPEDAIVVTGSRIARDPNIGSPAPILAVTAEQLQRAGTADVVDTLRDIPSLSTSISCLRDSEVQSISVRSSPSLSTTGGLTPQRSEIMSSMVSGWSSSILALICLRRKYRSSSVTPSSALLVRVSVVPITERLAIGMT